MRTYIGGFLLLFAIIAVAATIAFHTSVNGSLTFEQQRDNPDYINTNRSYRPPQVEARPKAEKTTKSTYRDDEDAEVAETKSTPGA